MFVRPFALASTLVLSSFSLFAQRPLLDPQMRFPGQGLREVGSLRGNVRGNDNQPLKNVRIELRQAGSASVYSAYTNAAGSFEISSLPSGTYELVATLGLDETRQRIECDGMACLANIRLAVTARPPDEAGRNSVSVAQYKVPEKAREEWKKASKAAAEQKNEEAEKHLANALALYPAYADALTLRGILKFSTRDLQGAAADFHQAIQADGNYALAYIALGACQNMESKFDDAIPSLQRAQTLSPASWQAYFEMGKALMGKSSYEPALVQLARAQALAPHNYSPIHLLKAHAMLALNHYSGAAVELQAYLAMDPNGSESQAARALLEKTKAFVAVNQPMD